MVLKSSPGHKPNAAQRRYAGNVARKLVRVLTVRGHDGIPTAQSMSRYYTIDDLKAALIAARRGETIRFRGPPERQLADQLEIERGDR